MRQYVILFLFTLPGFSLYAQNEEDSLKTLDEVVVKAFAQNRKLRESTMTVRTIVSNNGDLYNKTSLVNGFNTIAGVRMEERSPGSYRINIRGSSLRSPFGVRNVKVYWNDIPVTDPGGNTYFNQFAYNNFSDILIFKGPAGSLYGAGTGGLILMNTMTGWKPGADVEYITGSYSLQNIFAAARFGNNDNQNQLTYAHNQSNGYRDHTAMRRDNFSWESRLPVSGRQELRAAVLFTDMYYQTPGALTLNEYRADPRTARPAAGPFPSSETAKAAIFQKNISTGFTNTYSLSSRIKNNTTLYGTFSQIKNPAVRNYERRNEPGYGARTVFSFSNKNETGTVEQQAGTLRVQAGSEFQQGFFNTQVSKNKNGNPDTLQTNDDIQYTASSFFIQGDLSAEASWFFNAGVSINKTKVNFTRRSVYPVEKQNRGYRNEFAPRLSVRKNLGKSVYLKATVSRGFSPPTIAELLPSTGVISTDLEAEYGWNREFTAGGYLLHNKLNIEVTGFIFKLNNALVQRRDLSGGDFFINAGDVKQRGAELHSQYLLLYRHTSVLDYLNLRADFTYNHFRYGTFIKGNDDFSGKKVPSVPSGTISVLADLGFKKGIYTTVSYYSASDIYLNDANSAAAAAYHLAGIRVGWKVPVNNKYRINLYAGADNLFDETYSLGNDINAAAGRYYNAAPRRNYYAGIAFKWIHTKK